jgi:hypothetical protein
MNNNPKTAESIGSAVLGNLQFIGGGGEGMRASGGELLKKLDQNFQLG